jgi:hypothetical protein
VPAALGLRVLDTTRQHSGVLGAARADARRPVAGSQRPADRRIVIAGSGRFTGTGGGSHVD